MWHIPLALILAGGISWAGFQMFYSPSFFVLFFTFQDKEDVQSIIVLQRFFEAKLSAAFGDRKFSALREPINIDEPQKENTLASRVSPVTDPGEAVSSKADSSSGDEGMAS